MLVSRYIANGRSPAGSAQKNDYVLTITSDKNQAPRRKKGEKTAAGRGQ